MRGARGLHLGGGGWSSGLCLDCESERLVEVVGVAVEVVVEDLAKFYLASQIHYNHYKTAETTQLHLKQPPKSPYLPSKPDPLPTLPIFSFISLEVFLPPSGTFSLLNNSPRARCNIK